MVTLEVLVGIPASGKSTYAKEKAIEQGCIYISSDKIREELCNDVNCQDKNKEVFNEMYKRTVQELNFGYDVIYDATNIKSKNRKELLKRIRSDVHDIVCNVTVFLIPVSTCLHMNENRDRKVPLSVILKMVDDFEVPDFNREGWDNIYIKCLKENDINKYDKECYLFY